LQNWVVNPTPHGSSFSDTLIASCLEQMRRRIRSRTVFTTGFSKLETITFHIGDPAISHGKADGSFMGWDFLTPFFSAFTTETPSAY